MGPRPRLGSKGMQPRRERRRVRSEKEEKEIERLAFVVQLGYKCWEVKESERMNYWGDGFAEYDNWC
jgi:uncharacterized protein YpmB